MANKLLNQFGNFVGGLERGAINIGKRVVHGLTDALNQSGSLGDNTYKGMQKLRDSAPKQTKIINNK